MYETTNDEEYIQLGTRECKNLPCGLPRAWYDLPIHVTVGLVLTEYNCVYRAFFEEYAVASLESAIKRVAEYEGAFLLYQFYSPGITPAYEWDADWPLMRRGKNPPNKRQKIQEAEPWIWTADKTLFEIRVEPRHAWEGLPYLRVGGRSPEQAMANWNKSAKTIRSIYRNTTKKGKEEESKE